jgi:phenylpropionate dioxygenase-like ring-hydroxylating dioxygenase large terminal subunit
MLSRDDNELLTRTGPGTPMGELFRRYWVPALLESELPEPDCNPVRIGLLGEKLIAFRDSQGRPGLLAENCPHRGASLFFGRNEECGLRCVYHGWKFDITGQCVDMPNEPPESNFKDKIGAASYPCIDRGGVVWAYMGPPPLKPEPPDLEWALVPPDQRYVSKRWQETNYAQAMEGGIDSSHVSFLHRDLSRQRPASDAMKYLKEDGAPHFEVVDTPYGFLIGARRTADADSYYWRITQWLFPWYTMIPPFGDNAIGGHAWVPSDDEHCWTFSVSWHPTRAFSEQDLDSIESGSWIHPRKIPGTFRPIRNKSNDYLIDRQAQRNGSSYTGIFGISEQDTAVQESMGPIYDRSQEHVGAADTAIIQMRRRLLKAAHDLHRGVDPPGLDPAAFRVRSVSVVLPRNVPAWPEAAREAMTAEAGRFVVSVR